MTTREDVNDAHCILDELMTDHPWQYFKQLHEKNNGGRGTKPTWTRWSGKNNRRRQMGLPDRTSGSWKQTAAVDVEYNLGVPEQISARIEILLLCPERRCFF